MQSGISRIKTRPMLVIERRIGRSLEDELADRYFDRLQTQEQIGAALGVTGATISRWMAQLGIEARFPGSRAS